MSRVSVENYEELVRRSNLVKEPDLKRVVAEAVKETGNRNPPAEVLGQKLIAAGLLTQWQNDKLMQGKHQGFFLGKYKLLKHLTSGGMSSVYLAEHTMMNRRVAIKVLPPARIDDKSYLPRFRRECQAMALLDHPNIVRAHDFDVQGTLHYMVLEYIDGVDLQKLTDKHGPVDFNKAADCIRQAALGLQHAHDKNFVHRDMKPANLMVDSKGFCKVLDLGVARITGSDEGPSLTLAHKEDVLGTADFLAPEQALNSHHVDHRADVYALGCTLYYMLTGHVPFREPNLAKKLMAHQTQEPPPLTQSRPDCPKRLIEICQTMMAKSADDRYQTMNEVADALGDFLRGSGMPVAERSGPMTEGSSLNVPIEPVKNAAINLVTFDGKPAKAEPPAPQKPAPQKPSFATPPSFTARPAAPPPAPLQEPTPSSSGSAAQDDDESLYGVKETSAQKPAGFIPSWGVNAEGERDDEASSIHTDDARDAAEAASSMKTTPMSKEPSSRPAPGAPSAANTSLPRPAPLPSINRTVATGGSSSGSSATNRSEPGRPETGRPEANRPESGRPAPASMREEAAPLQRVRVLQNRPAPWYSNPLVLGLVIAVVLLTSILVALIVVLVTGNAAKWLNIPALQPVSAATAEATPPVPVAEPTLPAGPADTAE